MNKLWRGLWSGVMATLCLHQAIAAKFSRDPVQEAKYEAQLNAMAPSQVETFRAATAAYDNKQYTEAAKLFEAVIAAAPHYDTAIRRLAYCDFQTGHHAEAIRLAETALSLNRDEENLSGLAYILSSNSENRADQSRAFKLIQEARSLPGGADLNNDSLAAQLALAAEEAPVFHQIAEALRTRYPTTFQAHYFAAVEAILDEHWIRAEKEILAARNLGLPAETAQRMLDSGVHARALRWKMAWCFSGIIGGWMVGLGLLFLMGLCLSLATLRSVAASDPNVVLSNGERRLRKIYSGVVNIAGIYYYISLPIVLVIVVSLCAGIFIAILSAGFIMIKLTAILAIGAIMTIVAMVRSLFLKPSKVEPGRPLRPEEAPGLWALAKEVARDVDTRPIDEIRITEGTDLAVYERGSWQAKMRDQAKRVLILGIGIVEGFKQDQLRSVLAHEYGHFSHRDTAGGDIALRVRQDMMNFYLAMYKAGQATKLNAAFHFLRVYNFIFRRISHGATRLQEVLADRIAAQTYGALAFEGGLTHVIRRRFEFEHVANTEIKEVLKSREPLRSIYEPAVGKLDTVDAQFKTVMERPTTDDDTHPSPKDRFRFVATVTSIPRPASDAEVWDLFADREAIKREMIQKVEQHIAPHRK